MSWEKEHRREGCNGANIGAEGEVEWQTGGYGRDVVFRLNYCVGAVT